MIGAPLWDFVSSCFGGEAFCALTDSGANIL
jgi:hypothetical protein